MKNFGKGIGGALLSLAFVFGVTIATSDRAQAQDRRYDGNHQRGRDDNDRNRSSRRRRHRDDDWNRRNQAEWRRNRSRNDGVYNAGRYGNNGRYGDRNRTIYRNNGQYGSNRGYGNGGYNQVELNRGYQQGVETGSSDGQRGQSYNPQRSRHFKNASSQTFREGFVRGYDQGFRQYSNGNGRYGKQRNDNGWGNILGGVFGRP